MQNEGSLGSARLAVQANTRALALVRPPARPPAFPTSHTSQRATRATHLPQPVEVDEVAGAVGREEVQCVSCLHCAQVGPHLQGMAGQGQAQEGRQDRQR